MIRDSLIASLIMLFPFYGLCESQLNENVDLRNAKKIGEEVGKEACGNLLPTINTLLDNQDTIEALNYKGTDIKEAEYNASNMGDEAARLASNPNNEASNLVRKGFLRGKEFEVLGGDNFLDKAKHVEENPNEYVNFLSGKYTDCKVHASDVVEKREYVCDEYTSYSENTCTVGRKIIVDAKHEYICTKSRESYEKECNKILSLKCKQSVECDTGGIVLTSIASDMKWQHFRSMLTIGTIAYHYWRSPCNKYTRNIDFEIKNKDAIQEFRMVQAEYDDYMRIVLNGTQVYIGPDDGDKLEIVGGGRHGLVDTGKVKKVCERNTSWKFSTNIDLKPYLKEGKNRIEFEVVVGGRGEGWITIKTKQRCCSEWEEVWTEECERVR